MKMNRCRKLWTALLVFCMVFQLGVLPSQAAEEKEPYQYQITFYAGNQGSFSGAGGIEVMDADGRRVAAKMRVSSDGSSICVDGLETGYTVSFVDIQGDAVSLGENSAYYVRGLRKGGYDNDTVDRSSFVVEQDQDYVVAYGIRGDMVSYVINYQDAAGNTLAPSRTYYGNVGDRPVIAFLYIDGYEPQAYNLTKTLSKNEAENVFTFVYSKARSAGSAGGGTAGEEEENPTPATPDTPAAGTTGTEGAGGDAPAGVGAAGADGVGAPGGVAADGAGAAGAEPGVDAPDGNVPLEDGPEELRDLDDEEVPLAERIGGMAEGTVNMLSATAVGVTAAVALMLLLVILMKRRRKATANENDT